LAEYFEPIKSPTIEEPKPLFPIGGSLIPTVDAESKDVSIIERLTSDMSATSLSNLDPSNANAHANASGIGYYHYENENDDATSIVSSNSSIDMKPPMPSTSSAIPHAHPHMQSHLHPHRSTSLLQMSLENQSSHHSSYQCMDHSYAKNEASVSAQDFFFNNPNKNKIALSSTSLDDPSLLSSSPPSQSQVNSKKIPYGQFNAPTATTTTTNTLSNMSNAPGLKQTESITSTISSTPSTTTSTTFKTKPLIRSVTPQPLVNEILSKKALTEPKLSSMRISRSNHPSHLRNLKTSSIISLDTKLKDYSSKGSDAAAPLKAHITGAFESGYDDSYNPDMVSKNYTDLLQSEENGLLDLYKKDDKVTPFGGFSRPHKFLNEEESIFSNCTWKVSESAKGNGSLINSVDGAKESGVADFKWVGAISMASNIVPDSIKGEITSELSKNYNSDAIFIDDEVFQGHYHSFCKQILWPIFHYQIPDNPNSNAFENHSWKYYEKVNQIFAQKIAEKYKEGDVVWVHDYHLMLVPSMLRKLIPTAKIGFFLHISFPSSEVFRCLAQRNKILEGMLGADCITFQNEEYMAHFLQSSNRLLLADFNAAGVFYKDRLTVVSYNPIGLDFKHLDLKLKSNIVRNWKDLIKERWGNKKLIVSRDKIDSIRGLKEKLLAYERFLDDHPDYISKVILILICVNGSADEDYENEIFSIIERINSKTENISIDQPVTLLNRDIEFEQYLALLSEADVYMVSTLREGMNLTCHEFICATEALHSPLILSEFVGSASVLTKGPLISNPYNIKEVASDIYKCLTMSAVEKTERWNSTFQEVINNDSITWVKKCINDIDLAYDKSTLTQTHSILTPLSSEKYGSLRSDSGKKLYVLNLDDLTANLQIHGHKIHSSQQQLIIKTLSALSSNEDNDVYIFSLAQRSELLRLYARVSGIGLIAENGGLIKPPRSNSWYTVIDESEKAWIPTVVEIIKSFCERIPGSYIEVEECTVSFHTDTVGDIDPDYLNGLIGDLITHINELFGKDYNVHATLLEGNLIIKEMNLISRALQFISEQLTEDEHIKEVQLTGSSFTSPIFQATTSFSPALYMRKTPSSSSLTSPIVQSVPLSPIQLSGPTLETSNSYFSSDLKPYECMFVCGSITRIDEEIYNFFNNFAESNNLDPDSVISVCVGETGSVRTCAKYSLKGINKLMKLLN
jgi:trehalose-6-phosphate synthase/trehalose-6-phosphatase